MTSRSQIFAWRPVEHCGRRSGKWRRPAAILLLLAVAAMGANPPNAGQGGGNQNQNLNQNPNLIVAPGLGQPAQVAPGFVPGAPGQAGLPPQAQGAAAQQAAAQGPGGQQFGGASGGSSPTNGPQNPVPQAVYYRGFIALQEGDYRRALESFRGDLKYALRTASTGWVDSICYYTMMGESYYRMGHLTEALDNYNAALRIYLAFPDWMTRGVRFPAAIQTQNEAAAAPWGRSARGAKLGRMPDTMVVYAGMNIVDPLPSQNGMNTYGPAMPLTVNVKEIIRCTTLAMKRRQEILGPIAPLDKMSEDLASLTLRHPAPPGICSDVWLEAEMGMAYLGTGQARQGADCLQRAISLPGELDHTLTPLILLQLGELSLQAGDLKSAANWFEEASYSAFQFGDFETLEDAFRLGQETHVRTNPRGPGQSKQLPAALAWSRSQSHARALHASLLLCSAENGALSSQPGAATSPLGEAKGLINHRDLAGGEIGSRMNYLSALVAFHQGNLRAGDAALADAMAFEKTGSKRLLQIGLADYYLEAQKGPHIGSKRALPMLETVLRDPASGDWAADPLESLAVLEAPNGHIYEHWFEASLPGGVEASLEIADRARRHRFLSTLPLGGRLLALRWTLEAPANSLGPQALIQRQSLLANYPKYGELSKQVAKLRDEVAAAPLWPVDADAEHKQATQLAEIARLSSQQEALIREMAVRREGVDLAFPPLRKTKEIQAALAPRQLLLMFFSSGGNTYAWLMSRGRCAAWKLDSQALEKKTAALLRAMGNADANGEVPQKLLAGDDAWRQAARELTDAIVADSKINLNGGIDELIVVPDGALWYVPFETLQISDAGLPIKQDKDSVSLISKTRVRYLPTMGLAMPERQDRRGTDQMGVVLGKTGPHETPAAVQAELARLQKLAPHVSALKAPLPAASPVYGALFDTLVVFDDWAASERGGSASSKGSAANYEWSPIPLDRVKSNGSLSQWFALPWKGPTQIILPDFHTLAETGLRQQGSAPAGNDLFLSVCGLMSTGARTVLISRWRTGGQTSQELVRQFAQELPFSGAADAWQRSVQLLADDPVEVEQEPRVQRAPAVEGLTARHPFFWSGYMLVDTGWTPPADKQPTAAKK